MHSSLTAAVLCIFAQCAAAECVVAADVRQGTETLAPAHLTALPGTSRAGGELIKTAAAGTRDAPAASRQKVSVMPVEPSEEHSPRSGTAMLLAALALMSGIVLRRYSTGKQ